MEKYYKPTTKELGKGAFGEVLMYESIDESVKDQYAVKIIDKTKI